MSHFSLLIPWVCETQICEPFYSIFGQGDYATDTPRRMDVDLMSILRRYVKKKISINFHVILTYFFDAISMGEKSTSFRRTFFNVTLISEKSTSFQRTFFDVISMSEKSISFRRTLFGVTSMSEISTSPRCTRSRLFWCIFWCNFDGKLM